MCTPPIGLGFLSRPGHAKDNRKNYTNCLSAWHAGVREEFGSATRLCKRPGSVWNCRWGHALYKDPLGSIARVEYGVPAPGVMSCV